MSNETPEPKDAGTKGNTGRDADGRSALGNQLGPDDPFLRRIVALRKVLVNCCTPEVLQSIANKLIEKAKRGHVGSIKLLLAWSRSATQQR